MLESVRKCKGGPDTFPPGLQSLNALHCPRCHFTLLSRLQLTLHSCLLLHSARFTLSFTLVQWSLYTLDAAKISYSFKQSRLALQNSFCHFSLSSTVGRLQP